MKSCRDGGEYIHRGKSSFFHTCDESVTLYRYVHCPAIVVCRSIIIIIIIIICNHISVVSYVRYLHYQHPTKCSARVDKRAGPFGDAVIIILLPTRRPMQKLYSFFRVLFENVIFKTFRKKKVPTHPTV